MISFRTLTVLLLSALTSGFLLFLCTVPSLPVPDCISDILFFSEHCSWIASMDRLLPQMILNYLLGTGLALCFTKKVSQILGGKLFIINSNKNSFDLGLATFFF